MYNIPLGGGLFKGPWAIGGSGSTYIYGYCDATFREDWGQEETVEFVKNGESLFLSFPLSSSLLPLPLALVPPSSRSFASTDLSLTRGPRTAALALAMSRDGSSGGTIRLAIITEAGVERVFVPGNELPPFGDKL